MKTPLILSKTLSLGITYAQVYQKFYTHSNLMTFSAYCSSSLYPLNVYQEGK